MTMRMGTKYHRLKKAKMMNTRRYFKQLSNCLDNAGPVQLELV